MRFQEFMEKSLLMGLYRDYQTYLTPLNQELKKEGLNFNESLVLLSLFFESEKGATPGQLCKTLFIKKDQLSPMIARLENMNLISESRHPGDRRKKLLHLRAPGRKLATRLIKIFDTRESHLENKTDESQ